MAAVAAVVAEEDAAAVVATPMEVHWASGAAAVVVAEEAVAQCLAFTGIDLTGLIK